jgi:hypothetical protein
MGSITRSFANNIGSSGILTASAVTNATVEDVTSFDNAASPATLVLLSTQTASNSASISFTTGLDSTYDEYIFKFINIAPATNDVGFHFQGSTNGGSSYGVTMTTTAFRASHAESDASTSFGYASNNDLAQSTSYQEIGQSGNDADQNIASTLTLFNPSSTTYVKHFTITTNYTDHGDETYNSFYAGYFNTTSAINALNFKMSSGNIASGTIKLYGVKKS